VVDDDSFTPYVDSSSDEEIIDHNIEYDVDTWYRG
jgi:hypothetical protein